MPERFASVLVDDGIAEDRTGAVRTGTETLNSYIGEGKELYAQACFAAGTPLRTPEGAKRVEDIQVGEFVLSRDENHPAGAIEPKVVEEVFRRFSPVLHLHIGGQVIRTTGEHPFYAHENGWLAAKELKVGDWLLAEDGRWQVMEDLLDTGVWEPVFNLRIADWHTYFVGASEWE